MKIFTNVALVLCIAGCQSQRPSETRTLEAEEQSVDVITVARMEVFPPETLSTLDSAFVEPFSRQVKGSIRLSRALSVSDLQELGIRVHGVSGSIATATFTLAEALAWSKLDEILSIDSGTTLNPASQAGSATVPAASEALETVVPGVWLWRDAKLSKFKPNLASRVEEARANALARTLSGFVQFEAELELEEAEAKTGLRLNGMSGTRSTFNKQPVAAVLGASVVPEVKRISSAQQLDPHPSIGVGN